MMPSNSHPLSPPASIFPSIRVFSKEGALPIMWPNYWSFSISISPSNEYSGLISFRIDLFDLLKVQVTLKSLLQHHSSKASILQCSAFFMVQFPHPYMTTGRTIPLTLWTFVGKVMSLLFNMLSAAAAAKSLQSCSTLCDPIDSSPPGSAVTSALLTMPKPLTVWTTTNWKIPKEMGIPDHLSYLLRNLYAGQETTVKTGC